MTPNAAKQALPSPAKSAPQTQTQPSQNASTYVSILATKETLLSPKNVSEPKSESTPKTGASPYVTKSNAQIIQSGSESTLSKITDIKMSPLVSESARVDKAGGSNKGELNNAVDVVTARKEAYAKKREDDAAAMTHEGLIAAAAAQQLKEKLVCMLVCWCMCVCVYCMCVLHVCVCIYIYTCKYLCTVYVSVCVCVCKYTHIYTWKGKE